MDKQLDELIRAYQAKVHEALVLMHRSGIRMPSSNMHWAEADIPEDGLLDGDIAYQKHGVGCTVYLPDGEVDFDFGGQGEINGFDSWRLFLFAGERQSLYGFDSLSAIETKLKKAAAEGRLIRSDDSLFYVSNLKRELAIYIDSSLASDNLPARNLDTVLVLHCHYFQAADLMFENYNGLRQKWKKYNTLSHRKFVDLRIYMSSWLGFLAVTCEGFESLRMRILLQNSRPPRFNALIPMSDAIGKLIKQHRHPLRELRNTTFHLRDNPEAAQRFFDPDADRLKWARELHGAFADFFSAYGLQCEIHYATNGRKGELRVSREPPHKYPKW